VVFERMLAGVSARRYRGTQEPLGSDVEQTARSTNKSAISRTFVARTRETLAELMSRRLDDIRWVATLPPHVNVNAIELMPTALGFPPLQVHRAATAAD
jgi:hypothetical protein